MKVKYLKPILILGRVCWIMSIIRLRLSSRDKVFWSLRKVWIKRRNRRSNRMKKNRRRNRMMKNRRSFSC